MEPYFHQDSYGYQPGKSALQAIRVTRQRCWRYDFLLEFDIKGLFDGIDHSLLMRVVRKHTDCPWILLYIERWLRAPVQWAEGTLSAREQGTAQGSVISPLLANLFLHYVFDKWMVRNFPSNPFARYADDGVVHCRSEVEAEALKESLERRFRECWLELHPEKTKIVCCKVTQQPHTQASKKFDFLGFCFRPRLARSRQGRLFVTFTPALSAASAKKIRQQVRRWRLKSRTALSLDDIARPINPIITGWINYYGAYYRSALYPVLRHIDLHLVRWVKRKYRRKGRYFKRAKEWLGKVARYRPKLFAHWQFGVAFSG